jgi:hypothetical protein
VTFYTIFFLSRDVGVMFGQSSLIARELAAKDGYVDMQQLLK